MRREAILEKKSVEMLVLGVANDKPKVNKGLIATIAAGNKVIYNLPGS